MRTASTIDLTYVTWRKSTHSGNGTDCVEVSDDLDAVVPVRDSKKPTGAVVVFTSTAWTSFIGRIHAGHIGMTR